MAGQGWFFCVPRPSQIRELVFGPRQRRQPPPPPPPPAFGVFERVRRRGAKFDIMFDAPGVPVMDASASSSAPPQPPHPLPELEYPDDVIEFSYADLDRATWMDRKIGEGHTAIVFRGILNGKPVAIKKLKGRFLNEFDNELRVMCGMPCHENVVKLLGFCNSNNEHYLVYDFLDGGSLESLLFSNNIENVHLNWNHRVQIALHIARGLLHTHHHDLVHGDLKPGNVLLDQVGIAKVADFGYAQKLSEASFVQLREFPFTIGYVDPALASKGINSNDKMVPESLNAARLMWITDKRLKNPPLNQVEMLLQLANKCRDKSEGERPTAGDIVTIIESIIAS